MVGFIKKEIVKTRRKVGGIRTKMIFCLEIMKILRLVKRRTQKILMSYPSGQIFAIQLTPNLVSCIRKFKN